jgi:hypothetical protein
MRYAIPFVVLSLLAACTDAPGPDGGLPMPDSGAPPHLTWEIEHAWLGNAGDELRSADPGPYRDRPATPWGAQAWEREQADERRRWIPWAFDAPETAEGLLMRAGGSGPPRLAPLALAVDAVALMLAVPQPREVAA